MVVVLRRPAAAPDPALGGRRACEIPEDDSRIELAACSASRPQEYLSPLTSSFPSLFLFRLPSLWHIAVPLAIAAHFGVAGEGQPRLPAGGASGPPQGHPGPSRGTRGGFAGTFVPKGSPNAGVSPLRAALLLAWANRGASSGDRRPKSVTKPPTPAKPWEGAVAHDTRSGAKGVEDGAGPMERHAAHLPGHAEAHHSLPHERGGAAGRTAAPAQEELPPRSPAKGPAESPSGDGAADPSRRPTEVPLVRTDMAGGVMEEAGPT